MPEKKDRGHLRVVKDEKAESLEAQRAAKLAEMKENPLWNKQMPGLSEGKNQ